MPGVRSRAGRKTKDERRKQILESTWKLIARGGLGATSMRTLAAEAGYANGALAYYFEDKDDLLRAAFEHVIGQTAHRIAAAMRGLTGLAALRAFCAEMLPEDEVKLLEARVVVPFWSAALTDAAFAEQHERSIASCRKLMRKCLTQAVARREIPRPNRPKQHAEAVETLLTILTGAQVLAVLSPHQHNKKMMWRMVDDFLERLARG